MIAKDSETTGVDGHHGAVPFFLTCCDATGKQTWWESDVDPLTRLVKWPKEDLKELQDCCNLHQEWVYHHSKFDIGMENNVGVEHPKDIWDRVEDTLLASHVLASNQPHNLTYLVREYLGKDIEPYENRLETAVKECRAKVQQARLKDKRSRAKGKGSLFGSDDPIAEWAIADEGRSDMPSATKETWRFDYWLPKAMAKYLGLPGGHPYHTVLRDYANMDSAATAALWPVMKDLLHRRGLWGYYRERMKLVPIIWEMERQGVTINRKELVSLKQGYQIESAAAAEECVAIARDKGYDLILPKGSRNDSIANFCFKTLKLPAYKHGKTGPAMDAETRQRWETELGHDSIEGRFANALGLKAKKDTHISYLEGYERYAIRIATSDKGTDGSSEKGRGLQIGEQGRRLAGSLLAQQNRETTGQPGISIDAGRDWYILHPSVNLTGTATTRFSSSNPNSQNISGKEDEEKVTVRHIFGPLPGREWWSIDATNIELRIPAYEANEKEMIALFEKPDEPPYYGAVHLLNFSTVYPDLWEQGLAAAGLEKVGEWCKTVQKPWYKRCKNGGFAIQYGAIDMDGGTADKALGRIGAQRKIRDRFRCIHGSGGLNERQCRFADEHGYVETIPDKTIDPNHGYPLLVTRTEYGKVLPTVPLSYHVQGTAGWWMGRSMARVAPQLAEWNQGKEPGTGYYLVLTIHDQLIYDFPRGQGKESHKWNLPKVRKLQSLMEQGGLDIGIPTPCSVSYHPESWGKELSVT